MKPEKLETINSIEEFIEQFVKINYQEEYELYGHYPFQMFIENSDSEVELHSLLLGGKVKACYKRARDYFDNYAKKIFLSVDCSSNEYTRNDFVIVFSVIEKKIKCVIIPYDSKTGQRHPSITKGELLDKELHNFKKWINIKNGN